MPHIYESMDTPKIVNRHPPVIRGPRDPGYLVVGIMQYNLNNHSLLTHLIGIWSIGTYTVVLKFQGVYGVRPKDLE